MVVLNDVKSLNMVVFYDNKLFLTKAFNAEAAGCMQTTVSSFSLIFFLSLSINK